MPAAQLGMIARLEMRVGNPHLRSNQRQHERESHASVKD